MSDTQTAFDRLLTSAVPPKRLGHAPTAVPRVDLGAGARALAVAPPCAWHIAPPRHDPSTRIVACPPLRIGHCPCAHCLGGLQRSNMTSKRLRARDWSAGTRCGRARKGCGCPVPRGGCQEAHRRGHLVHCDRCDRLDPVRICFCTPEEKRDSLPGIRGVLIHDGLLLASLQAHTVRAT